MWLILFFILQSRYNLFKNKDETLKIRLIHPGEQVSDVQDQSTWSVVLYVCLMSPVAPCLCRSGLTWEDDTTQKVLSRELSKLRRIPFTPQQNGPVYNTDGRLDTSLLSLGNQGDHRLRRRYWWRLLECKTEKNINLGLKVIKMIQENSLWFFKANIRWRFWAILIFLFVSFICLFFGDFLRIKSQQDVVHEWMKQADLQTTFFQRSFFRIKQCLWILLRILLDTEDNVTLMSHKLEWSSPPASWWRWYLSSNTSQFHSFRVKFILIFEFFLVYLGLFFSLSGLKTLSQMIRWKTQLEI